MRTKVILFLVFLVLFAVIIVQNNQNIPFRIFFWDLVVPKIILVPLLFFLGFLFGLAVGLSGGRKKPKSGGPAPGPAPVQP
jgi:uncharacterized integral membrane protein